MKMKLGGVRVRLWLATALPAMVVIALLVVGFASQYGERMADSLKDRGVASARQLGSAAEFMLFAGDREGLARLADAVMRSDALLRGVLIYNANGQLVASMGQVATHTLMLDKALHVQEREQLVVTQPIYPTAMPPLDDVYAPVPVAASKAAGNKERMLGHAVVSMSLQTLAEQRRELLIWSVVTALGGLVLAAALASLLANRVSAQIGQISRVVELVGEGHFGESIDETHSGILRPLAVGINAMVARIANTHEELQQQVAHATQELRDQKDAAELAARTDVLTGVASRRAFDEIAEIEMQRAWRYQSDLSLLMMDLDHFKVVNDTHGHVTGDAVLVSFAQTVQQLVRKVDLVARLGGEEFVVLLPNSSAEHATALAERIREAVSASHLLVDGKPLRYTVSIGVAQFDHRELSMTAWLARADAALYHAKDQGRDRVVLKMIEA